jgi:hypothetical protein
MEAMDLKEPDPEGMKSEVEHWEAPKEDAVGKLVKGRKKQHRGWKHAAEQHGEPMEVTQGDCGSQRKLTAACRKVSRHARVALCKRDVFRKILTWGNLASRIKLAATGMRMTRCTAMAWRREQGLQRQGKDDMAMRTLKGRMSRMKCQKDPECKIGIKDPGTRRQLHLKIERMSERIDRKAFGLRFVKRAPGMPSGFQKMSVPSETKKRLCTE